MVCLGVAGAQTPAPPAATPPAAASPAPRATLPNLPDATVIAVFDDGTKFTMGDLKRLYPALPDAMKGAVAGNTAEFFHEFALMRKLEAIAAEKKLDEESPTKEQLYLSRLDILSGAAMQDSYTNTTVPPNEIVNYYGKHKEEFKQVKVKIIYIPFADTAKDEKSLSEAQAKAKAEKLVAEIRHGADFVKLVKENSEDPDSKAKDGDFGTFTTTDSLPDPIRKAVFTLEMGDVTDPVRQPHGFYIFKADIVTIRPLSDVRDQIFTVLKQQHAKEWMDRINSEVKVEFPNPEFQPKAPGTPSK